MKKVNVFDIKKIKNELKNSIGYKNKEKPNHFKEYDKKMF